jgi:hypothetical protein
MDKIIVEESDVIFKSGIDYSDTINELFPVNELDFIWICDTNIKANWEKYKIALLKISNLKKLNSESLNHCLELISQENPEIALLPITAYQAKMNNQDIAWVITCKWDFIDYIMRIDDGEHVWIQYNHDRQWVFVTSEFKKIAYWSCE